MNRAKEAREQMNLKMRNAYIAEKARITKRNAKGLEVTNRERKELNALQAVYNASPNHGKAKTFFNSQN